MCQNCEVIRCHVKWPLEPGIQQADITRSLVTKAVLRLLSSLLLSFRLKLQCIKTSGLIVILSGYIRLSYPLTLDSDPTWNAGF